MNLSPKEQQVVQDALHHYRTIVLRRHPKDALFIARRTHNLKTIQSLLDRLMTEHINRVNNPQTEIGDFV